ncbi:hypothetical protein K431DRAFT_41917 [Polychaeton citri CBS 116435]|uniref:Uncharacterized protein n=1 Tax=Polychaeton citri CBS 116435 TaxID=1314669 RepID=A0A9P4QD42_9PEZI|nr:hypothetical protein K431DRAFT_41917 [Polychaeton citri CBS 116435]
MQQRNDGIFLDLHDRNGYMYAPAVRNPGLHVSEKWDADGVHDACMHARTAHVYVFSVGTASSHAFHHFSHPPTRCTSLPSPKFPSRGERVNRSEREAMGPRGRHLRRERTSPPNPSINPGKPTGQQGLPERHMQVTFVGRRRDTAGKWDLLPPGYLSVVACCGSPVVQASKSLLWGTKGLRAMCE